MAAMKVREVPIDDVRPYPGNPRNNDQAVEAVAASIREFGWRQPIVVDADMTVVCGHTRLKAAQRLGLGEVPVVVASDLTPEQVAAYRLADNKVAEASTWDMDALAIELDGLAGFDMGQFGFDSAGLPMDGLPACGETVGRDQPAPSLADRFGIVPFSVVRTDCGEWKARKARWISVGIRSEKGRGGDLCYRTGLLTDIKRG